MACTDLVSQDGFAAASSSLALAKRGVANRCFLWQIALVFAVDFLTSHALTCLENRE
jgi:hypothetical protein